MLLYKINL